MILYFANRLMRVIGMASTNLRGGISVVNDLKTEDVESGVATFSCNVLYDSSTRSQVETCASVGNYLFRNTGMGNELYTIVETENDTEAGSVYIYAEDAGLGLLNTVALAYSADSEKPISFYFEKWLDGTGFVIRRNDVPSEKKQLSWSSEATVTERLLDVAGQFDCEMSFGFDINGLSVAGKYVDIYRKRGKDIGVQLRLNSEVSKIVTKTTMENLATGLLAVGGNQSGSDVSVTLEGYSYDDGDCYVSGRYLYSRTALNRWGERGPDGQLSHIVRLFSSDTVSQENLCNLAVAELKKSSEPEVNYEIELAKPPDGLCIGDRVNIVDDAGALYLSARVLKLETSIADDTRTATLGEYLLKGSGISARVEELAGKFAAMAKDRTLYTWIAYADDAQGNGISLNPEGKPYLGTAVNQTEETADLADPTVFTWSKVQGPQGETGETGATGEQGPQGEKGEDGADAITMSVTSSNGTIFKNAAISTTLTAHVYRAGAELTAAQISALGTVKWYKDGGTTAAETGQTLTINAGDVTNKATYVAQLEDWPMAIKARAQITLSCVVDVAGVYRYYLLQSSTLAAPDKPTANPPGGNWNDTEPGYTSGSTNTLYFVDLTVFSDGAWIYSNVSTSSAYEAAKEAYNKAAAVSNTLNGLTLIDEEQVKVDGSKLYVDTEFVNSLFAQDITATGSITGATLVGAKIQGNEFDITAYENDEAALPVGVHLHGGPDEVWEDGEAPRNFTVSVSEIADDETLLKSSLAMYSNQIILDAADIYILADDSQPYNAIQLKAPYVCVEGGTVDLYGTVAINDLKMFIGPGDTVTITRMYCAGGVTGSAKTLYFFIPMARPIIDVSSATLSNPSEAIVTARKSAGGYIVQNAAVESVGTSSCAVYENGVAVSIAASEAYSATNNTPAAVTIENLELTFS